MNEQEVGPVYVEPLKEKDLNASTLARIALGLEPNVPKKYQVQGLVDKYLTNRSDPNTVALDIAVMIAQGAHPHEVLDKVKALGPDLPKEKLEKLQVEILIKAAGITSTEQLTNHQGQLTPKRRDKDIELIYQRAISENFDIRFHEAEKLVKNGIKFYKILSQFNSRFK